MQPVELMACMGCQKVYDQYKFPDRCKCSGRYFKAIHPTTIVVLRWFVEQPKHAISLILKYFREKYGKSRV